MKATWLAPVVAVLLATSAWAECVCKTVMAKDGWCGGCKIGFVDGVKLEHENLYKALQGMEVSEDKINCAGCKAAHASGGSCEHCHVTFVSNHAYKSPVAATLAHGKIVDKDAIACEGCKKAAASDGWCDHCTAGIVGNRVFMGKEQYEAAQHARKILTKATKKLAKCEGCAIAIVSDGTCGGCNVSFKGGKMAKADDHTGHDHP